MFVVGLVFGLIGIGALAAAPAPAAAVPAPAWASLAVSEPTNLPPGGEGAIVVYAQNVGGAPSSGPVTVQDQLPPGLTVSASATGEGWECLSPGPSEVSCTRTQPIAAGLASAPIKIPVSVGVAAGTTANRVVVSGGGAISSAVDEGPVVVSSTPAEPGTQVFSSGVHGADGGPGTQAGSHPFIATSAVFVNTIAVHGKVVPAGELRRIAIAQPPGFLGNPTATPGCVEGVEDADCPLETQVGIAQLFAGFPDQGLEAVAVHSARTPIGHSARFTFSSSLGTEDVQIGFFGDIRSDEDYSTVFDLGNAPRLANKPIYGAFLTLWGVPADPLHDELRCVLPQFKLGCGPATATPLALLTQPTDCALQAIQPPFESLSFEAWQTPGEIEHRQVAVPAVTGCEQLEFSADFTLDPSVAEASSPAAFEAHLTASTGGLTDPDGLAASPVRKVVVALPAGVGLNAGVADGLGVCSEAEIGLRGTGFPAPNRIRFGSAPNHCPDAAKIGTVEIESALLENPLAGKLYLASPGEGNPFGSLFALYLVVEDRATGIVMKLPGEVALDERSGQVTITFEDLPQLPLTSMRLSFKGGSRSLLATPDTCGEFVTVATSTPWSAPESGPPDVSEDSFAIDSGPGDSACAGTPRERPFDLGLQAGSGKVTAGAPSPFTTQITRSDGNQELDSLEIKPPAGFVASFRGVSYCGEAEIGVARASSGAAERASPACPAASQVGTVNTGAGSGSSPFYAKGRLSLAGPYRGAPLSMVAITPGIAGPFDLGNLVIRSALEVDSSSAQLTLQTDPIPQFLKGIQLRIRDIRIDLDRQDWTFNPTSCDAKRVDVEAHGNSGAIDNLGNRFQVGGCDALEFKPKLRLAVAGGTGRNGYPALTASLTQPPGQANVARVSVALPRSELLAQSHIRKVCTRAQFDRDACPARSVYGRAEVETRLLDEPLTGPVYLRSSSHKLPDLAIALSGPPRQPIEIDLAGRVDSSGGRIRVSLGSIPDVPVSRFVLRMQGGRKGLLVNSRDMCRGTHRAGVNLIGHNGKRVDRSPAVSASCGKEQAPTTLGRLHR